MIISRRRLVTAGALTVGGLIAAKWRTLADRSSYSAIVRAGDDLNFHATRLAMFSRPLAKVYDRGLITSNHPSNGGVGSRYIDPNPAYNAMQALEFADWRLQVGGLVERPLALSLAQLRAMPSQSQITMHSCDEGWSAIGEWTGVQLSRVLALSGILPEARYVVFRCLDTIKGVPMYGSIDLLDAVHPQTILAYEMNGAPLPVRHGAPLRLRVELQIGYKNMKHLKSIELVKSFVEIGKGCGGTAEDAGYQWYAGQ
jgi:DMSO/TMAO reductase YedYZ molybdopterin-dependent catalytic subunit